MTIELFGHKIEPYEHGYTLSEKFVSGKDYKEPWKEYWGEQVYPRDFIHALQMLREKRNSKIDTNTLDDTIEALKKLDTEFIENLKQLIK